MTVAADAADEAAMTALFDRFGTDLPPLGGIYLAAFGGGPVTLCDMTDDDVTAMFRPKLDAVALLHKPVAETAGAPVRVVLVDLWTARIALAGPLRGDDHLPRHLRLCASSGRASGHRRQLGPVEVAGRHPEPTRSAR